MRNSVLLMTILILMSTTICLAQKKRKKGKKQEVAQSLKLYQGDDLPAEEVVRIVSFTEGKKHAYFITIDGKEVPSKSLMTGPQDISFLPGDHSLQARFVSKGEIAIPIQPFEPINFEAGRTYVLKFEHTSGKGSYLSGAQNTRIRFWIVLLGQTEVLMETTVNGFGKFITD